MSLAELRDLQKHIVRTIANFEVRQRAEARSTLAILAQEMSDSLEELAAMEGSKLERAPSTTIYTHPENLALNWSGQGCKPGGFAAHVDASKDPDELL